MTVEEALEHLIKSNESLHGYIEKLNSELSKRNPKLDFVVKGYETVQGAEYEVKAVETAIKALTLLEKQEQGCEVCKRQDFVDYRIGDKGTLFENRVLLVVGKKDPKHKHFAFCPNCGRKMNKEEAEAEVKEDGR